jgi:aryl-alcohol dehydrogenase-like predicted oxidoreductase
VVDQRAELTWGWPRVTGATPSGTEAFRQEALKRGVAPGHFREVEGLQASSIGIGTYLGESDEATDERYRRSLVEAVLGGTNVIDTAINYRCQRSERTIGRALTELASLGVAREQVILCTKGGYLPFDGTPPSSPRDYFEKRFLAKGILKAEDLVSGIHALAPGFLRDQVATSLENLGSGTIDVYYLHNPETQLAAVGRKAFLERLRSAFECLEELAEDGQLRFYGTATWSGYRSRARSKDWLSIEEIVAVAREAGGETHRFRFVQAPYNLAMTEIFSEPNQPLGDKMVSLCVAADALGVNLVSSASIAQGRLKSGLPEWLGTLFRGASSDVQRALQFARSTPGVSVALVGMKTEAHVRENLGTARIPPAAVEDFLKLFEVQ